MRAGFGFTSPAQTWDEMTGLMPPFQGITPAQVARDPKAKIPDDKVCAVVIEAIYIPKNAEMKFRRFLVCFQKLIVVRQELQLWDLFQP